MTARATIGYTDDPTTIAVETAEHTAAAAAAAATQTELDAREYHLAQWIIYLTAGVGMAALAAGVAIMWQWKEKKR